MHKKLAADLTSLAHSILQIKNKSHVFTLRDKAQQVYEKLAMLAYIEEYVNRPGVSETKEEMIAIIEKADNRKEIADTKIIEEELPNVAAEMLADKNIVTIDEEHIEEINVAIEDDVTAADTPIIEEITEQPFDELQELLFSETDDVKNDVKNVGERKTLTLEEELEDTISLDVAADMFEKVSSKKSLNEQLQGNIQIGLNDRIAFVKHLFDGDQGDFNRVVSQLNTFKTHKDAKKFINKMVKPDYNWSDKDEYEARFMAIIERKFA